MSDIGIWKWRYADYSNERLREISRRDKPGKEGNSALAAMEILAERVKQARNNDRNHPHPDLSRRSRAAARCGLPGVGVAQPRSAGSGSIGAVYR